MLMLVYSKLQMERGALL